MGLAWHQRDFPLAGCFRPVQSSPIIPVTLTSRQGMKGLRTAEWILTPVPSKIGQSKRVPRHHWILHITFTPFQKTILQVFSKIVKSSCYCCCSFTERASFGLQSISGFCNVDGNTSTKKPDRLSLHPSTITRPASFRKPYFP